MANIALNTSRSEEIRGRAENGIIRRINGTIEPRGYKREKSPWKQRRRENKEGRQKLGIGQGQGQGGRITKELRMTPQKYQRIHGIRQQKDKSSLGGRQGGKESGAMDFQLEKGN